jgi:5-(carboxyamino)imidazole ribonucleotide mutase
VRILAAGSDEDAASLRRRMLQFQDELREQAVAKGERLRRSRGRAAGFGPA